MEAIPGLIPGSSLIAVDVEEGARAVPAVSKMPQSMPQIQGSPGMR